MARATYRPPVAPTTVVSLDMASGRVCRYVRVQATAGVRPTPYRTDSFILEGFDRYEHTITKSSVEELRRDGAGGLADAVIKPFATR